MTTNPSDGVSRSQTAPGAATKYLPLDELCNFETPLPGPSGWSQ
jgi:hypothetical protein